MQSIRELEAQAKALAPILKGLVDRAVELLRGENAKLKEDVLAAIPSAEYIAKQAAALVIIPEVKDGEPGKDADPEEVKRLVAEAVAEIPHPKDGASVTVDDLAPVIAEQLGKAVAELPKPKDGASVPIEDVQRLVAEEVARQMAAIKLPEPRHGDDGRDALQMEILPAIDPEKSYPRGTYATHGGGLWRAYELTKAMRGWECIVDGVAGVDVQQDDHRGITVAVQMASGKVEHKAFNLPAMIYRGVYQPGMHHPGDTVTWGGSLWHCDAPTEDKPGEIGSKGWTLCAKKGRDGKDGTNGRDLTKGVPIK